jgi:hypothetical protein
MVRNSIKCKRFDYLSIRTGPIFTKFELPFCHYGGRLVSVTTFAKSAITNGDKSSFSIIRLTKDTLNDVLKQAQITDNKKRR